MKNSKKIFLCTVLFLISFISYANQIIYTFPNNVVVEQGETQNIGINIQNIGNNQGQSTYSITPNGAVPPGLISFSGGSSSQQILISVTYIVICNENLNITVDVTSNQTDIQDAENTITVLNTINNNATAEYDAGNTLILAPGFKAKPGANFKAYIDGCSSSAPLLSSINSKSKKTSVLKLYPNPTKNTFFIESSKQIQKWELLNQFGRILLNHYSYVKGQTEINLSGYIKGMYFLKMTFDDGETIVKTIIKE